MLCKIPQNTSHIKLQDLSKTLAFSTLWAWGHNNTTTLFKKRLPWSMVLPKKAPCSHFPSASYRSMFLFMLTLIIALTLTLTLLNFNNPIGRCTIGSSITWGLVGFYKFVVSSFKNSSWDAKVMRGLSLQPLMSHIMNIMGPNKAVFPQTFVAIDGMCNHLWKERKKRDRKSHMDNVLLLRTCVQLVHNFHWLDVPMSHVQMPLLIKTMIVSKISQKSFMQIMHGLHLIMF